MAGNKNSGRRKLSASAHILRGTFRKDRHGEDESPEPPLGAPAPPVDLKGHAKAEWERMVARLDTVHTLSVVDDAALYQYVRLFEETECIREDYDRLRKLSGTLMKMARKLQGGDLVEALGKVTALEHQMGRQTIRLRQGHMAIRQYLVEFGMTPSARTKVKTLGGGAEVPQSKVDLFRRSKTGA
jgi:P27 family predicted phage terminase small subunit